MMQFFFIKCFHTIYICECDVLSIKFGDREQGSQVVNYRIKKITITVQQAPQLSARADASRIFHTANVLFNYLFC